jgi:hypothetical protein
MRCRRGPFAAREAEPVGGQITRIARSQCEPTFTTSLIIFKKR